jgi:rare lipoprotein A (peptidoglycan hydrolase)
VINFYSSQLWCQRRLWIVNLTLTIFFSCQSAIWAVDGVRPSSKVYLPVRTPSSGEKKHSFSGNVSWYGPGLHGKKTASGEIFDMNKSTAAHLTLPFGTHVLVEDPRTGKTAIVKVNDRGPYVHTRVMDVSKEGGRKLGLLTRGVAYVDCLIIN